MKNIIEKIKFYFKKHEFYYKNGRGITVDSYSLFTDTVCVRYSEFGYVSHYERMPRGKYLELITTYQ
jgi:hypothetical protein